MKQCPQCRRTYDDSQAFCLMDGTALVIEDEPATVMRQQTPAPKKSRVFLWVALLLIVPVLAIIVVAAAFILYTYNAKSETASSNTQNSATVSPSRSTTPKTSPTSGSTNNSSTANTSPTTNSTSTNEDSDEITPIGWDTSGTGFKTDPGTIYKFRCPKDGTQGYIWGSDIYTSDSSICTAAVHAGIITLADGGVVTVEFRPGRQTYGSTERNGITSSTYGEYAASFVVR